MPVILSVAAVAGMVAAPQDVLAVVEDQGMFIIQVVLLIIHLGAY